MFVIRDDVVCKVFVTREFHICYKKRSMEGKASAITEFHICYRKRGVVLLSYLLQGKGERRCLTQGGFTSATRREGRKLFIIREISLCYEEWKMESVGHKEDSKQLVEGREWFLVKRIPMFFKKSV